ncbi:diguanylate cyclase (GGDEF) domain-containing protein [Gracilibacillus orientalis]|uniref:Diguanylate cyclase (GGDEF) domain-containing protein n=1 Tax=Gracilibacillus orientalis TaxID=334253 RepID=A0A1I4JVJ0_9BACI|nr:GGDEF domain-containing protein [Gracilibacillus orientalis]SFL70550.1 diguanylate cyclase (GGDEF) domain-containing protein [Gracilibacillus orientalis]
MAGTRPTRLNNKIWTKKILYIYWLMVIMAFLGQIVGLITTIYYYPNYIGEFIIQKLFIPSSIQVVILLITHFFINYKQIFSSRLLTIAGTSLALVTIVSHPEVHGLQVLFLLTMAVVLIYFDKKKLRFSLIVNLIALSSLYALPSIRETGNFYDYFSYHFVLLAGYMAYLIIIERGNEVFQFLQRAAENEKELIVKSAMMERLSKVDALTGLYNHKTFHEYLDFLYEQSISQGMPLHLALIDIDSFKMINDFYGHSNGDLVLRRVANAISDQVTEDDIVARYGGEEFAILLTNKSLEEAYETIETLRLYIANQYHEELNENISISIGLKALTADISKELFFNRADELLYKAKRNGKNQVIYEKDERHLIVE